MPPWPACDKYNVELTLPSELLVEDPIGEVIPETTIKLNHPDRRPPTVTACRNPP